MSDFIFQLLGGNYMNHTNSDDLFEQSKKAIPGGVNSPVRAFLNVGRNPLFIKSAKGSHITDVDGNTYLDYVCSWDRESLVTRMTK